MDDKKLCKECKEWLDKTDFYVKNRAPDGRAPRCRTCTRKKAKISAKKHVELKKKSDVDGSYMNGNDWIY